MSPSIAAVLLREVNEEGADLFTKQVPQSQSLRWGKLTRALGLCERCPGKGQTAEQYNKDGDGERDCYEPIRRQRKKR